jgi:hypothetical protein
LFTKVEVRTPKGDLLTLRLGDVTGGLNLKDVAGLDPVKAILASSAFGDQDGEVYQSARRGSRNITMKIGLDPDPSLGTVLALRRQVYAFFRPKSPVNLKFFVDDTDDTIEDGYVINGYVEDCASPMFSQTPELNISIICFNPDFTDPVPVTVSGLSSTASAATYIPYVGTVDTGFVFTLNVNAAMSEFALYYVDGLLNTWTMDFAASLLAGDVITISTVPGNKYADLLRAGVTSSILYGVSPQSVWPLLAPGDNWLRVSATPTPASTASISYIKRYGEL